ncbi:putative histone deacetylase [Rosa chinensis]|uniref:Putative histone deacetylase n=1 Tax=Rosa chinensis TaxID=74649 RepID=A0A2P6QXK0_ROSCH|nr:putative histone deacetylase [Rosa chinensis]
MVKFMLEHLEKSVWDIRRVLLGRSLREEDCRSIHPPRMGCVLWRFIIARNFGDLNKMANFFAVLCSTEFCIVSLPLFFCLLINIIFISYCYSGAFLFRIQIKFALGTVCYQLLLLWIQPVAQNIRVDHHPGGGHWFAAGLSPNYSRKLDEALEVAAHNFALVFIIYNAGTDILDGDPLGSAFLSLCHANNGYPSNFGV